MLVDEIAARLISQSVGGAPGSTEAWVVVRGYLPDAPDRVVGVFETGGPMAEGTQALHRPTFQVFLRGQSTGRQAVRTKAEAVRAALDKLGGVTLSGTTYIDCRLTGDPIHIGDDEVGRPEMSLNFEAWRMST